MLMRSRREWGHLNATLDAKQAKYNFALAVRRLLPVTLSSVFSVFPCVPPFVGSPGISEVTLSLGMFMPYIRVYIKTCGCFS